MELTGSHIHLKLRGDRGQELQRVFGSLFNPEHLPTLPEWARGEVWVVGLPPVQGRHSVPAHEDVGAPLDGGNRRARYHLHPHAVVTVHHAVRDLHLPAQTKQLWGTETENNSFLEALSHPAIPYPGDCGVRVIGQEVAGKREGLSVGVDDGQREQLPCRPPQGPAVTKDARAALNLPLVAHSHTDNLVAAHLGG